MQKSRFTVKLKPFCWINPRSNGWLLKFSNFLKSVFDWFDNFIVLFLMATDPVVGWHLVSKTQQKTDLESHHQQPEGGPGLSEIEPVFLDPVVSCNSCWRTPTNLHWGHKRERVWGYITSLYIPLLTTSTEPFGGQASCLWQPIFTFSDTYPRICHITIAWNF